MIIKKKDSIEGERQKSIKSQNASQVRHKSFFAPKTGCFGRFVMRHNTKKPTPTAATSPIGPSFCVVISKNHHQLVMLATPLHHQLVMLALPLHHQLVMRSDAKKPALWRA